MTEEPKFKCHICPKQCYTYDELKQHLQYHFTKEKMN